MLVDEGFSATPNKTSTGAGAWHTAGTWSPSGVPTSTDWVQINHAVTVDASASRTLNFWTLHIGAAGSLTANFSGTNNTCDLVISNTAYVDTSQFDTGIIVQGVLTLTGKTVKTWTRTTGELAASATSITVTDASGWEVGGRFVIMDTREKDNFVTNRTNYTPEERSITSISGSGPYTIGFTTGLAHAYPCGKNHSGTIERYIPVAYLTRNIVIRSASPSGTRGHMIFGDNATGALTYIDVQDMGRTLNTDTYPGLHATTNRAGRYPVHFHHLMVDGGCTLYGCTIERFKKWGLSIHDTNEHHIQWNVVYNGHGWGIGTEEGNEFDNVIEDNFVCYIGAGSTGDSNGHRGDNTKPEWGTSGDGFWFQGPRSIVRRNVTGNNACGGYQIWLLEEDAGGVGTRFETVALNTFEDNEAIGCERGLAPWMLGRTDVDSIVLRFIGWHNAGGGDDIFNYNSQRLIYRDCILLGQYSGSLASASTYGFLFGDYPAAHNIVEGCRIENKKFAIYPCQGSASPTPAAGWASIFPQIIRNCTFHNNDIDLLLVTQDTSYSPTLQQDLEWQLINNTHGTPRGGGYWFKKYVQDGTQASLRTRYTCNVYTFNGNPSDNFRVYAPEQAGGAIMIQSHGQTIGSVESGQTNAYNLATYGYTTLGEITPGTATTRTNIYGSIDSIAALDVTQEPLAVPFGLSVARFRR